MGWRTCVLFCFFDIQFNVASKIDEKFTVHVYFFFQIQVHGIDRHAYPCQLSHIDVSGCRVLTSSGIRYLTTLCGPTLQHVNISYTEVSTITLYIRESLQRAMLVSDW